MSHLQLSMQMTTMEKKHLCVAKKESITNEIFNT